MECFSLFVLLFIHAYLHLSQYPAKYKNPCYLPCFHVSNIFNFCQVHFYFFFVRIRRLNSFNPTNNPTDRTCHDFECMHQSPIKIFCIELSAESAVLYRNPTSVYYKFHNHDAIGKDRQKHSFIGIRLCELSYMTKHDQCNIVTSWVFV